MYGFWGIKYGIFSFQGGSGDGLGMESYDSVV